VLSASGQREGGRRGRKERREERMGEGEKEGGRRKEEGMITFIKPFSSFFSFKYSSTPSHQTGPDGTYL
jgi:hypothetical protein